MYCVATKLRPHAHVAWYRNSKSPGLVSYYFVLKKMAGSWPSWQGIGHSPADCQNLEKPGEKSKKPGMHRSNPETRRSVPPAPRVAPTISRFCPLANPLDSVACRVDSGEHRAVSTTYPLGSIARRAGPPSSRAVPMQNRVHSNPVGFALNWATADLR